MVAAFTWSNKGLKAFDLSMKQNQYLTISDVNKNFLHLQISITLIVM